MKKQNSLIQVVLIPMVIYCLLLAVPTASFCQSGKTDEAKEILETAGVTGGLVVHVNCGDGVLTDALRAGDAFIVHGLDREYENVQQTRRHIISKSRYGPVSVDQLKGSRLPYTDNLINLLVSENLGGIPMAEVMRVLCPKGVAMIKEDGQWKKTVKPRPGEMDDWTHYLYGTGNNPVSKDTLVGPMKHYQWIGSPRWARHHDTMASMSALVSSNGRLFYIFDEGPSESIQLPAKWALIARDAFNGTILWKRSIDEWQTSLFALKSGPAHLPRRLVAVGDRVFVTLGINAPLVELDAVTGKTVRTFDNTGKTSEILLSDNTLFILVGRPEKTKEEYVPDPKNTWVWDNPKTARKGWAWGEAERRIMAVNADTGKMLWEKKCPVAPMTLGADEGAVYYYDGKKAVCLDRNTGEENWQSAPLEKRSMITTAYGPRIIIHEDVVLFSGGTGKMLALSAADGKTLWEARQQPSGHYSPEDLIVLDGLVWTGAIANTGNTGTFTGRDIHTGEVKNEFAPDEEIYWFHQRCYPSKATENFIIPSRTGVEFVDVDKQDWNINHYVRGGCLYGIMPANSFIYTPPHACACYIETKLNGFCALAPSLESGIDMTSGADGARLEKGPAYDAQIVDDGKAGDWPTYRHDAKRSGYTPVSVSSNVDRKWRTALGGKLSSPVISGNRIYVSKVNAHTIYALDAQTGEPLWQYTAGGRIDSPPTIYQGRVLFGSVDGYIYCLRASDGVLSWRYRAAPVDRRIMAFEQLESAWPVNGSVLIQDGRLYAVAGRTMFLDSGMRLLQLNPETGEKISESILDEKDPESGKNLHTLVTGLNMPVALPDILSSDGKYLYMRSQQFDLEGNRKHVPPRVLTDQQGEGVHLFSPVGFLDDTQFVRSYMMYGKSVASGWGLWSFPGRLVPSGRIIAVDDKHVYGYGRKPEYLSESIILECMLYAADKSANMESIGNVMLKSTIKMEAAAPDGKWLSSVADWKLRQGFPMKDRSAVDYKWRVEQPPIQPRAMVVADSVLFVAGPPDVVNEEETYLDLGDQANQKKLAEQNAILQGEKGSLLWAISTADGKKLAEYPLASLPVWDGMAAAGGRLFLTTLDGDVVCFNEKGN